jgi:hypothetical protein
LEDVPQLAKPWKVDAFVEVALTLLLSGLLGELIVLSLRFLAQNTGVNTTLGQ